MRPYHVSVSREDNWYIGRVLERSEVTTSRSLDELVDILRDAIPLMRSEVDIQLELILSPNRTIGKRKRGTRNRAIA